MYLILAKERLDQEEVDTQHEIASKVNSLNDDFKAFVRNYHFN